MSNFFFKNPKITKAIIISAFALEIAAIGTLIYLGIKSIKSFNLAHDQIWKIFEAAPRNIFSLEGFNFVFGKHYGSFKEIDDYLNWFHIVPRTSQRSGFISRHTLEQNDTLLNSFNNYTREYLEKIPLDQRTPEINKFLELSNKQEHDLMKLENSDHRYIYFFFALVAVAALIGTICVLTPAKDLEQTIVNEQGKPNSINPTS